MFMRNICSVVLLAFALMLLPSKAARAASDDGIVRIKSAYSMPEAIKRIKKDVADKGITFSTRSTSPSSRPMPVSPCARQCSSCSAIRRSERCS